MKAVVVHQYGGPEVLKFEEYPDPVAGPGEVLVQVAATSVNPIDYKRRAGLTKEFYPINFPGLMGVDIAGTVVTVGPGVEGFSARRPGVCNGGGHIRRTLRCESRDSGESSQRTRFDPGGGVAAGDDDWQPAHFRYRDQSGPDGSRRRCCGKCRAFGGIHCKATGSSRDCRGSEEPDG